FFQSNNSWADNVAFVTQCPIGVNDSFEYTFPTAFLGRLLSSDSDMTSEGPGRHVLVTQLSLFVPCQYASFRLINILPPSDAVL
ncbi:hypothetical protein C8R47DRAFT_994868, partial [Mycena vitilis]